MEWMRARTPVLSVRREALFVLPTPDSPGGTSVLRDREGKHLLTSYVVYFDPTAIAGFEDTVLPVLTALRRARARVAAAFPTDELTSATQLAYCIERCRALDVTTMADLKGGWTRNSLDLVAAANPEFFRVGAEFISGVMTVPEQFRVLVTLAEVARERRIGLVARDVESDAEVDAVRLAGIQLFQRTLSPMSSETGPAARGTLGNSRRATVLPFRRG
jgi:EAL domain-containing protein (putative c-di-GMP-specific phosphodiesterase class I)